MLAHFAEVMKPEPRRVADAETRKLRISVACRSQLNQTMTAELRRQSFVGPGLVVKGRRAVDLVFPRLTHHMRLLIARRSSSIERRGRFRPWT